MGYENYRHQADVCHAYQILKAGGLEDENIIVFMYDDIANNTANPRPGVIINKPDGSDVYAGVPKDYTGENCTAENFYAVILANKTGLTGGSGKVLNTTPDDHIFIYYTDHGGPGIIAMPVGDLIYADDLIKVLTAKHAAGTYNRLVFYVEACESGSMFEGLLPKDINVYGLTASNATEPSWGYYCPDQGNTTSPPPEYDTCLGDLFSIAWMEDSDVRDATKETLQQQFKTVHRRTLNSSATGPDVEFSSHVTQYGGVNITTDFMNTYIGLNPLTVNRTSVDNGGYTPSYAVSQYDANLLHFMQKYKSATDSKVRTKTYQKLMGEVDSRNKVDNAMSFIGRELFGKEKGSHVLNTIRTPGRPLVDDWDCLRTFVKTYENYCGSLTSYGRIYMRAMANMCNAGIKADQMAIASAKACDVKS
ncbi:vacuolar-processing enzyme-like [Rutidosis leptorrhynchoides]|uniref:vacuolar-processing enzyme-like n=1 Tax=Rutidosis leptorrhynchoides TaxID=125765 RepID=UPI003A98FBA4